MKKLLRCQQDWCNSGPVCCLYTPIKFLWTGKLPYGNFGLVWALLFAFVLFIWGCLLRGWLVQCFLIFTKFLSTTVWLSWSAYSLNSNFSVRRLTSPAITLSLTCSEIGNGKYCMFISSNFCNKPEQKVVLPDVRNCASIVRSWSSALCQSLWSQKVEMWAVERWSWRIICVWSRTWANRWEVREEGERWSEKISLLPSTDWAESSLGQCPAEHSSLQNFLAMITPVEVSENVVLLEVRMEGRKLKTPKKPPKLCSCSSFLCSFSHFVFINSTCV